MARIPAQPKGNSSGDGPLVAMAGSEPSSATALAAGPHYARTGLEKRLGLSAVAALVIGDMLGSGVFFTPGELAGIAQHPWEVYFIWALAGVITLCGALTLGELCSLLPRAGASYHFIREGFGSFWGFLFVWMSFWVSGPGAVAGLAASVGEFVQSARGLQPGGTAVLIGVAAILFFAVMNLLGVVWGARTQIVLTVFKVGGLACLVVGGVWLAGATPAMAPRPVVAQAHGFGDFVHIAGHGIAAVLFTFDGWTDVSHVASEVRRPKRDLPLGLGLGVAALTLLYLVVNFSYLRVVPLETMRQAPTATAARVATAAFGARGGQLLNGLIIVSMLGALGGLIMTLPRLFYAIALEYGTSRGGVVSLLLAPLGRVSPKSAVPSGAIVFTGLASIGALVSFGSFSKLVNFLVVPTQVANILMVAAIFRLRRRLGEAEYKTPGYPFTPIIYVVVLLGFLISAVIDRPLETITGIALSATGIPVYFWLNGPRHKYAGAHT